MKLDPITSLAISMQSGPGLFALLLGSGVSRSAKIPTGWDIILDLIRRLAKASGEDCEPDPEAWYVRKFGTDPSYSELLKSLAPTQALRQRLLGAYFEPTEDEKAAGLKEPTPAHRAIAKLVARGYVRVILTTNFDRLLERAIQDEGIAPSVLSSADAIAGAAPLVHLKCVVVKLHGDYLDTRLRNTPDELSSYEPVVDQLLDRVFDEYGLVVCGWSGEWDGALRSAIQRCKSRRYGFHWASISPLQPTAQQLVEHRGGKVVQIAGADAFFTALESKVSAIEESHADHPASIDAAVALVKRYAASPEHRIRLHDLLMTEAVAAFQFAGQMHDKWHNDRGGMKGREFLEKVAQGLGKLRQMVAHAAYHGSSDIFDVLVKLVAKISVEPLAPHQSGTLRDDWYRVFLGLNIFYAAGVSFVLAGRHVEAFRFAMTAYSDGRNERESFTIAFRDEFNQLQGFGNLGLNRGQHVPPSEIMFSALASELLPLSSSATGFAQVFDEWELLVAFASGELEKMVFKHDELRWMTPGRFVYTLRGGHRSALYPPVNQNDSLDLCRAQAPFQELIRAGFFSGKWERVMELRKILLTMASHPSWR